MTSLVSLFVMYARKTHWVSPLIALVLSDAQYYRLSLEVVDD